MAKSSDHTYSQSRMKKALNALGFPVSRYMTEKLMKEAGVWVRSKKKYKVTTDSNHKLPLSTMCSIENLMLLVSRISGLRKAG